MISDCHPGTHGNKLVGVVSIRHVAALMGTTHTFREIMLNVSGGLTILLAIIIVGYLLYMITQDNLHICQTKTSARNSCFIFISHTFVSFIKCASEPAV